MGELEKIVEKLSTLTVMEAAELSKLLEEKRGVSAATAVASAAPADGGGGAETPHFSSRSLESSAASITVKVDNFSTIFSSSPIIFSFQN
jgi:ribosomal protein L7/L12